MTRTREEWLNLSVEILRPYFESHGLTIPDRVSIAPGFPYGSKKAVGQCWSPEMTQDGTVQIFIAPIDHHKNPIVALGTVVHELVHAAVGLKAKHGKLFADAARAVGLEGKPKSATVAPNTPLWDYLSVVAERLGPYPDDPISIKAKPVKNRAEHITLTYKKDPNQFIRVTNKCMKELIETGHWDSFLNHHYVASTVRGWQKLTLVELDCDADA